MLRAVVTALGWTLTSVLAVLVVVLWAKVSAFVRILGWPGVWIVTGVTALAGFLAIGGSFILLDEQLGPQTRRERQAGVMLAITLLAITLIGVFRLTDFDIGAKVATVIYVAVVLAPIIMACSRGRL